MSVDLSILIPAHNEADYIGPCLGALAASQATGAQTEVIVIANGCTDDTARVAERFSEKYAALGWGFRVLDLPQGGKMGALNAGDAAAQFPARAYLDADVVVTPSLMAEIADVLDHEGARYASGTPQVAPAKSFVTQQYARFWQTLPFLKEGVPGFGIFAVNAAGRARWDAFPGIISDDTFVRLSFAPNERVKVAARYSWPMIEGFTRLVKVRRRQDEGVREVAEKFPQLIENDDPPSQQTPPVWQRFLRDPIGFGIYGAVALATRLPSRSAGTWARGR